MLWNEKGILFNYADDQFLEEIFDGANTIPNPLVNFVDVQAVLKTPTTVEITLFNRNGMLPESYKNYYPTPGPIY
jgi:hypothetical protein